MSSPEFISPDTSASGGDESSHYSDRSFLEKPSFSPQAPKKLATGDLQRSLKPKPDKYIIIDNPINRSSACSTLFGFPAGVDKNGRDKPIENFIFGRKCSATYSFISNII